MTLLYAVTAVLTVAVAADLLLSGAVLRRLRDLEARLDRDAAPVGLPLGAPLPAAALRHHPDLATTPLLVGFFSTTCRYCPDQAALLAERAAAYTGAGIRIVSVVVTAPGDDATTLTGVLDAAGPVIVETGPGELMPAFGTAGTPAFLHFDAAGTLAARGVTVDDVPLPVRS